MRIPSKLVPHICVFTACFFWAISFVASKQALSSAPPFTVVMLRLLVATLCFRIYFLIVGRPLPRVDLRTTGKIFLFSLFGTSLHFVTQTVGLQYTTASNASLYAVTGPISLILIGALFLRERLTKTKSLGILLALLGVFVAMGPETLRQFDLRGHLFGDLLVITSVVMFSVFSVLGKQLTSRLPALELTFLANVAGVITMIPIALLEMRQLGFHYQQITAASWAGILFLGITCSFLATLLYFVALSKTESQKVGVYMYLIPPMTYLFSAFYLGEQIGRWLLVGTGVVLAGVYLTQRRLNWPGRTSRQDTPAPL